METTILLALQSIRLPFLVQVAALVSALGNYGFIWIVFAIVMLFSYDSRHVGITVIAAIILSGIISGFILQPLFAHVRPCDAGVGISAVMGVSRTGFSLPSFHATSSFAAAMVIAMTSGRRWGTWAFIGAILISLSRMYLGVEWPLDILAGAGIGMLIGLVSAWVYNQFLHDIVIGYSVGPKSKGGRTSVRSSAVHKRR